MKQHPATTLVALCLMGLLHPLQTAYSQQETSPTVPEQGAGGPKAVDLEPAESKPSEKMGTIPRDNLPITEIVSGAADFTTLAAALRATGLDESLKKEGPYTLLAPDNGAFAKLPKGVLELLMKPESRDMLRKILSYHMIPRKVASSGMIPGDYTTSQGEALTVVGGAKGKIAVQGAGFGRSDVAAKNGVIHVVKAVLIPPTMNIEDYKPTNSP